MYCFIANRSIAVVQFVRFALFHVSFIDIYYARILCVCFDKGNKVAIE